MIDRLRSLGLAPITWILTGLILVLIAGAIVVHSVRTSTVQFTTPYQAVLLTNGSVYFGHLHDYGSLNPTLTDVFYVVSQTDPATKEVKSTLIKRGKELHEPDRMYLNPNQIVFVESVGTNSKIAQLIAQAPH